MNLTILPEAALDDASSIDTIVAEISNSLEILDRAVKNNIPEHIETEWSVDLLENWTKYYNENIQNAMAGMSLSASNLKSAVDMAVKYSKN